MKKLNKVVVPIKKDDWIKDSSGDFNITAKIESFTKTGEFLSVLNQRLSYNKDVIYWYEDENSEFVRFVDDNFKKSNGYNTNIDLDYLIARCHASFKNEYTKSELFSKSFVKALNDNKFVDNILSKLLREVSSSSPEGEMLESMLLWDQEKQIDEKNIIKLWKYSFLEEYYQKYDGILNTKLDIFLNKAINDIYERSERCVEELESNHAFRFVFIDIFTIDNTSFLEEYLRQRYIDDKLEESQVLLMQLIMACIIDSVSNNIAIIVRELWFFYGFFIQSNPVMHDELIDIYTTFLVRLHDKIINESNKYINLKNFGFNNLKELAKFINTEEKNIAKSICDYIRLYLIGVKIFK
ncbi:hypothetical protein [Spiroplasma endosymbiont of Aspidapion aeneum]|uniref:hypothetical protein n=1 Tax=Spiroplasma endosymbiont of Aspidapion aeneum TaxID=3066276 RepID=UPI00313DB859